MVAFSEMGTTERNMLERPEEHLRPDHDGL